MRTLPPSNKNSIEAPHVVILGAGASIAAYRDWGSIGKPLPSMQDVIDILNLRQVLEENGYDANGLNFESLYDELASSGAHPELRAMIEKRVNEYFSALELPPIPTLYDYLVLSLRGKDLIASFNWDPFLLQALMRNQAVGTKNLPNVAFLHGNVLVGVCAADGVCGVNGQRCSKCGNVFTPSELLYPVRHKDYTSDRFIKGEWDRLKRFLNRAYYLTIFGYSAPKTDIEARTLMLDVWKLNSSLELAEIDIADIKSREEIEATWDEFLYSHHYMVTDNICHSYLFQHPRRTCDAFYSATMMCDPWHDNPFPRFDSLAELQRWVTPLVDEEVALRRDGSPFSTKPLPPNSS